MILLPNFRLLRRRQQQSKMTLIMALAKRRRIIYLSERLQVTGQRVVATGIFVVVGGGVPVLTSYLRKFGRRSYLLEAGGRKQRPIIGEHLSTGFGQALVGAVAGAGNKPRLFALLSRRRRSRRRRRLSRF